MEAQGPDHGYQVKMEQMGEQGTPVQHYHGPEHLLFGRISQSTAKVPEMPMQARYEDGAEFRWLNKKVLDSRVLDSMEGLSTWSFTGAGEMTLAGVHIKDGRRSLRIRSTTNVAQVDGGAE